MKRVIVYGGKGALGSALVHHFKTKKFWVCSVDLSENTSADANVVVKGSTLVEQADLVKSEVGKLVKDSATKFDGIFCVAGGWAGGNASSDEFVKNTDLMVKQSVWTSVISAQLAAHYLTEGGILTLTGAVPCLKGTSFMMGYGLAKAAVHQLTKSLADDKSGLPKDSCIQTILPVTLDTPMNRKFMADADFSTWTPLSYVADMFTTWLEDRSSRKPNGSLVKLITKDSKTEQELA